jgi:hypothetical protein
LDKVDGKIVVSKNAFWLSYCGMQKTIRQGLVGPTKKLVATAWQYNPWLTFCRLHTIMLEDIGAANRDLMLKAACFYESGKSYKILADVLELAELMAISQKNRECDVVGEFVKLSQSSIGLERAKEIVSDNPILLDPRFGTFDLYEDPDFNGQHAIVVFAQKVDLKLSKEGHAKFLPLLCKIAGETIYSVGRDCCDSVSHGVLYKDLLPFTELDVHGFHGKTVLGIADKKLKERKFYQKYPFFVEEPEQLGEFLFVFEGSKCNNFVDILGIEDLYREMYYYSFAGTDIAYPEFIDDFNSEVIVPLKSLRQWYFEKNGDPVIKEINDVNGENQEMEHEPYY